MVSRSFRDMHVWRKAHELVLDTYRYTAAMPKQELYGLTSQLRRAAVSVPANIAEGFSRKGRLEKARFYNMAQGSLAECRYYFLLAQDLNYGEASDLSAQAEEVSRILTAYIASLLARTAPPLKRP